MDFLFPLLARYGRLFWPTVDLRPHDPLPHGRLSYRPGHGRVPGLGADVRIHIDSLCRRVSLRPPRQTACYPVRAFLLLFLHVPLRMDHVSSPDVSHPFHFRNDRTLFLHEPDGLFHGVVSKLPCLFHDADDFRHVRGMVCRTASLRVVPPDLRKLASAVLDPGRYRHTALLRSAFLLV